MGRSLKKKHGDLILSSNLSTFTNGLELQGGALTLANSSTGSVLNQLVTGPLGTGTLTIDGGTTVQADGTARAIFNAVTVAGDFTFGGGTTGNNLTLNGVIDLGSGIRTVTVTNPLVTGTLGGAVSGAGGLTKSGNGILLLSGGNSYTVPPPYWEAS
ncbi:MAG: hypothetical protein WDN28_13135 [Chthoniobacter sp.]